MTICFGRKITKTACAALFAVGLMGAASNVAAAGLPGEYVISDRWRHIYSQYSGITNPAFINEENYLTLRFLFANTLQEFYMHEAGVTMPIGLYGAAGVSWMMQGATSYEATNADGGNIGLQIRDQTHFAALSYAHNVWGRLTVGGNLNIIAQNIANIDENSGIAAGNDMRLGFGIDLGLTWRAMRHPMFGNHLIGLSTNNIFNMILDTDETYASAFRVSLLSDFWERRIFFGADLLLKDFLSQDIDWTELTPGSGISKQVPWELSGKLGFDVLRIFRAYLLTGMDPDGVDHYGFAFGANMPGFFNGRDIQGMIQYVSIADSDGASHLSFFARMELGMHREEMYARKMARRGSIGPNNLYNQALELFHRGEFFRAYWIFSILAVEYPDFFRNDMVSYYQAACLEGMDMRQSAITSFRHTKNEHSRSTAVPMADLGLMRVFYRGGDFTAVANQFDELNALGVPDSIKFHAYYIMGQTMLQQGDFTRARELFMAVPDNHPDYIFAFHSAAVAHMLADNVQGAIADLESVVQIRPTNKAQEEMINRSYLFLGYLYYENLQEEGALARAVTALRRVPSTSYYYPDALLGLGWTALQARQWADCLTAGSALARTATSPILQAEGGLIQAYGHAQQRNFTQAVSVLEQTLKLLEEFTPPSESERNTRKTEYDGTRGEYEQMGFRIAELGQARQSSIVQTSIDSLQAPQTRSKSSIDQHLRWEEDFKRASFFSRSHEQVKSDVVYALAAFTRLGGARGTQRQLERTGTGDTSDLDDEIRRLEQELNE